MSAPVRACTMLSMPSRSDGTGRDHLERPDQPGLLPVLEFGYLVTGCACITSHDTDDCRFLALRRAFCGGTDRRHHAMHSDPVDQAARTARTGGPRRGAPRRDGGSRASPHRPRQRRTPQAARSVATPGAGPEHGLEAELRRASAIRRSGWATWRSSPVRPISPKAASGRSPRTSATPRAAEATASATARSAPGSSTRTPPATDTNTSLAPSPTPRVAGRARRARAPGGCGRPRRHPPGRHQLRGRDERLHLHEQRPRALHRAQHDRARAPAWPPPRTGPRRPRTSTSPLLAHLEHADLVGRPEAVLERAQRAVGALALALELEHAVHEVLEHARAGERALLGHVAHEHRRDAALLGHPHEPPGHLAHLADRAGRADQLARVQRLHRVDHADRRAARPRGWRPPTSRSVSATIGHPQRVAPRGARRAA